MYMYDVQYDMVVSMGILEYVDQVVTLGVIFLDDTKYIIEIDIMASKY